MPMEFDEQEVFFFKQKTAYEIPKRDWSSDVCSSDLAFVLYRDPEPLSVRAKFSLLPHMAL